MKKILILTLGLFFFCQSYAQELLDSWTLHYIVIDGDTINVPQPGPPNIFYHPKIEFYESSQGYEALASISPDNNYFFESQPPMVIEASTFTFQVGSVTLGKCYNYCDIEMNYFGTILTGIDRTFNYEITTAGNGDRTLVMISPEGNIAVHGDFILSNPDNEKSRVSLVPNPVQDEFQLSSPGITISNVKIFSVEGKQISKVQVSDNNSVNVSFLPSGLYFIEITDFDNRRYVQKFIKK